MYIYSAYILHTRRSFTCVNIACVICGRDIIMFLYYNTTDAGFKQKSQSYLCRSIEIILIAGANVRYIFFRENY